MRFATYTNSPDTLPEWITTERYMYCDNFINDYMHSEHLGKGTRSDNRAWLSTKRRLDESCKTIEQISCLRTDH